MSNSWANDPDRAEGINSQVPAPSHSVATGVSIVGIHPRELIISVTLFLLTGLTTLVHGVERARNFQQGGQMPFGLLEIAGELFRDPSLIWSGLPFSASLLLILLAHEMGHYLTCRYYRMRVTPPYFLPVPLISLVGTLGAFIRIRSPFGSRRALFDVGVAGPIAGFVALIPVLFYGIQHSTVVPLIPSDDAVLTFHNFGTPFLFQALWQLLQTPYAPATHTINLHPIGWAAWFGLFATCLNLLPIGQLDGGHITYALFGARSHRWISVATLGLLVWLSLRSLLDKQMPSYLVFAVILLIIGLRHPRTLNDGEEAGPARYWVGAVALLIFFCSFIPIPISLK